MSGRSAVDRRIFIVGVPRSGTTLLQSLLAAHTSVTSFTESHFFDGHYSRLPLIPTPLLSRDPAIRVREFLDENGSEGVAAADWFETGMGRWLRWWPLRPFWTSTAAHRFLEMLDELALRRGAASWVEKTPRHLRYVPFLERLSIDTPTHFVHVIRDGLEVVASLHRASQSWQRPYDLETCARRWNADVAFSAARVGCPNDHFVVYEELASRAEETLQGLVAELDLEWEPEILERYESAADLVTTRSEPWKADVGREIRPSETSGSTLTAEQRERASQLLDPNLYNRFLTAKKGEP